MKYLFADKLLVDVVMQEMNVHESAKSHGADTHLLPSRFFAAFADVIQESKRPQIDADYTD